MTQAYVAFCFLWAAAELLDLICFPDWVTHPAGVGLFVAAVALLLKPSSGGRLLAVCAMDVAYLWVKSPWTPNHFLFKGLVCLSILVAAGSQLWQGRERASAAGAAVLRWELLALYFFSFFHKLNADFLKPSVSCAVFMLEGLRERLPGIPAGEWVNEMAMGGALLIEGGIPVFLLFQRTRRWALLAAWGFHFLLSFHPRAGIYAFSAMMFALLTLFLPEGFYAELAAQVSRRPRVAAWGRGLARGLASGRWLGRLAAAGGGWALGGAAGLWWSGMQLRGSNLSEWPRMAGMALWVPFAVGLLWALWVGWPAGSEREVGRLRMAWRSPAVAVLGLVLVNGMAPYLGWQTVRVLSMFSNLRTEGGRSNHLLIPVSWQVAGYQRELVEIVSSTEPVLDFYARARQLIPLADVRRRIWEQGPGAEVTYVREGRTYSVKTSEPGAREALPPLSGWGRKILAFRGVNRDGTAECLW